MKAILAIAAIATSAHAITIDPAIYSGYAQGNGAAAAISQRPCPLKDKAAEGWKLARLFRGPGDPGILSCWHVAAPPFSNSISICRIIDEKPDDFSGCYLNSKDEFRTVRSLPRRAF